MQLERGWPRSRTRAFVERMDPWPGEAEWMDQEGSQAVKPGLELAKGRPSLCLGKEGAVKRTWAADLQVPPDHNLSPAKLAIELDHSTNIY